MNGAVDEDDNSDEEEPALKQHPLTEQDQLAAAKAAKASNRLLLADKKFAEVMKEIQEMEEFNAVLDGEHIIAYENDQELAAPADNDYPYTKHEPEGDGDKVPGSARRTTSPT